ncbi:fatty acid desaturase [Prochlorococcus marinus XMU1419]|uniref:fatty acid desaturase n=1 Tax=Prochlorococcus marinus TaxID=1219 RepID=UPI001ADAA566|nr:fatty acid desaturase [Prochlorococcus marinus]MBO8234391.1 fatty acid desaturase [Prochlorococcus marinus XMU1419]MBW3076077.1 fatty acid desaturase [Prochlorococcus marinus str. XMU1419]
MHDVKRSDFSIKPFLKRNNFRALYQILTTIIPIISIWLIIYQIINHPFSSLIKCLLLIPIICLLTLFSSRTFSLMHDCGHNSLFTKRKLNRLFGFLLGLINGIPQKSWSIDHAFHHRNNGNWEIYKGPIDVLSLEEYNSLSKREKIFYKISRNWIMLFPGGFFYLVLKPRLGLIIIIFNLTKDIVKETFIKIKNRRFSELLAINSRVKPPFTDYGDNFSELFELIINNVVVIIGWIFMCRWLGSVFFLSFYSLVTTLSAAILICVFFVQHNYQNAYAKNTQNWDIVDGAILGSSNLDIPNWLNWFLADISFHSIHHLSERIPNYNLRDCHKANMHLLHKSKFLKLRDFPNCFRYIIWDSKNEKLIPIS